MDGLQVNENIDDHDEIFANFMKNTSQRQDGSRIKTYVPATACYYVAYD